MDSLSFRGLKPPAPSGRFDFYPTLADSQRMRIGEDGAPGGLAKMGHPVESPKMGHPVEGEGATRPLIARSRDERGTAS